MKTGNGFSVAATILVLCLLQMAGSLRGDEAKEESLPVQPLDSPTAFMLKITERSRLGDETRILCDIAEALAQAGEAGGARKVCHMVLNAAEEVRKYNETTSGGGSSYVTPLGKSAAVLARIGDSQEALRITSRIYALKKGPYESRREKWEALCSIADGFTQAGDTKQAREICQQVLKLTGTIEKMPRVKDAKDENTKLLNILHAADDAAGEAWILGRIAESLAKTGDVKQAKGICEQALAITNQINIQPNEGSIQPPHAESKAHALCEIAAGLAQAGETKMALNVCQQTLQVAEMIELPVTRKAYPNEKNQVLREVARVMARAGGVKQAREIRLQALALANQIGPATAKMLRGFADVFEKQGDIKRAQELRQGAEKADKLIDCDTITALSRTAVELANSGETDQAREICQQALRYSNGIDPEYYKTTAQLDVAEALMKIGQAKQSLEVLKTALAPISRVKWPEVRIRLFGRVGKMLAVRDEKMKKTFDPDEKPLVAEILTLLPAR